MSLFMIHKAYMPVYSDPDFSCGTDGTGRTDQPKVVQEVLADLKTSNVYNTWAPVNPIIKGTSCAG